LEASTQSTSAADVIGGSAAGASAAEHAAPGDAAANSGAAQPALQSAVSARSFWLTILGGIAAVFALQAAQEFLVPVVLGIFLSYAFEPIVRAGIVSGLPRPLSAAMVLLSAIATVSLGVYFLSDDAVSVANDLPVAARELRRSLQRQHDSAGALPMQKVNELATEIEKSAAVATGGTPDTPQGVMRVQVEEKPFDVRAIIWKGSISALNLAANLVLLVFLTYFCMASGDLFKRKLVSIAGPSLSRKKVTVQVLDDISAHVQRFLFIQLVTSSIVAVLSWLAFRWIGLNNAPVWGIACGVFNTIPYFGPVIVIGALAAAGLIQFGAVGPVVELVTAAFAITSLEGFLLTPRLVGRAARMNDVAVFISLLFWGWLWGIVGMLIAIPMMMAIKSTCDRVEELKPVGALLGD
jgi:predicted PurR-regulated permease PerM